MGSPNPPKPPVYIKGGCQNGARAQGFASPRQKLARPLRAVRRSGGVVNATGGSGGMGFGALSQTGPRRTL